MITIVIGNDNNGYHNTYNNNNSQSFFQSLFFGEKPSYKHVPVQEYLIQGDKVIYKVFDSDLEKQYIGDFEKT